MRKFELKDFATKKVIVSLEWGVWAMHRFCELMGKIGEDGAVVALSLNEYVKLYIPGEDGKVTFSLNQVIKMVQAAAESAEEGKEVTAREAGRWIDAAGGLNNPKSHVLDFMRYVTGNTTTNDTEPPGGQKKSK